MCAALPCLPQLSAVPALSVGCCLQMPLAACLPLGVTRSLRQLLAWTAVEWQGGVCWVVLVVVLKTRAAVSTRTKTATTKAYVGGSAHSEGVLPALPVSVVCCLGARRWLLSPNATDRLSAPWCHSLSSSDACMDCSSMGRRRVLGRTVLCRAGGRAESADGSHHTHKHGDDEGPR